MPRSHRFAQTSRDLLRLAGPIIASQIALVLTGFVDTVMSGHAGAREQAVVALGVALWIPVFITFMNVVQAVSPLVAHHVGAGQAQAVVDVTRQGVWLAAGCGLVSVALVPFAPALLVVAGVDPGLAARTGVFLWGIGLGLPAALVYRALAFYSAAIGQTRPIMVLAFIGLGINIVLNWLLIPGRFGLPALGGAGCGWATAVGMGVSLVSLAAWTARAPVYRPYFLWHGWARPDLAALGRLLRLGLPMGGASLAEVAAFSSVAVLVARFGDVEVAAHQVAINFAALVYMVPMGLSAAIAIRVGHALGAGDGALARSVAWHGIALGLAAALGFIMPILAFRDGVAALYSSDAAVRAIVANLLLFVAFWIAFDALQVCALGALRGYKVTLAPMVVVLLAFWGLGIPVGAWLGLRGPGSAGPLQVYGFWAGLVLGLVVVAVGLLVLLRRVAVPLPAGAPGPIS